MNRRRHVLLQAIAAALCLIVLPGVAASQDVIFLTRHAERADQSSDSLLSSAGKIRAKRLAQILKDSGITQIFTSQKRRTILTAAPLAAALHLVATQVPAEDIDGLLARVHAAGPHDRLLIVGHSDTVPAILRRLGVTTPIVIGDTEYNNLFVVIPQASGPPRFVRLRFN
jgi:phosphohistidine phosphatase SixA